MSAGNLNTQGQSNKNTPWQRAVLKLLTAIDTALTGGSLTVTGTFTASSAQRTTSRIVVTFSGPGSGTGTVAAGAKWISFETSDDFTGTIEGVAAQASRNYMYPVLQNNDYYNAISYVATAGSITVGTAI